MQAAGMVNSLSLLPAKAWLPMLTMPEGIFTVSNLAPLNADSRILVTESLYVLPPVLYYTVAGMVTDVTGMLLVSVTFLTAAILSVVFTA